MLLQDPVLGGGILEPWPGLCHNPCIMEDSTPYGLSFLMCLIEWNDEQDNSLEATTCFKKCKALLKPCYDHYYSLFFPSCRVSSRPLTALLSWAQEPGCHSCQVCWPWSWGVAVGEGGKLGFPKGKKQWLPRELPCINPTIVLSKITALWRYNFQTIKFTLLNHIIQQ